MPPCTPSCATSARGSRRMRSAAGRSHGCGAGGAGAAPGARRLVAPPPAPHRRLAGRGGAGPAARAGLTISSRSRTASWLLPTGPAFTLTGRADRIERRTDGGIAILDYKTGTPPSATRRAGRAGAAAAAGGRDGGGRRVRRRSWSGRACELTYWHLTGGFVPGEVASLFKQRCRPDRGDGGHGAGPAGGPGRDVRRSGPPLSLAAASGAGAPLLRLHPTRPGGRMGRVGGGDERLPTTASARATARQREASDPTVSAFVAASAGSGKTKLLIDRLLRLMLEGADPARILCLTFTKAAAAEMALRLQRILGEWVTLAGGCADGSVEDPRHHAGSGGRPARPGAVRPGAGPAGRDADQHHPRLLPVAAAPLPAGGGAGPAFPPDGGVGRPCRAAGCPRGVDGAGGPGGAGHHRRAGQRHRVRPVGGGFAPACRPPAPAAAIPGAVGPHPARGGRVGRRCHDGAQRRGMAGRCGAACRRPIAGERHRQRTRVGRSHGRLARPAAGRGWSTGTSGCP